MKINTEDQLHKSFAHQILHYEFYKKLHCTFWTYMPFGEYRTPTTGSLLKSKGTKTGVPDYLFIKTIDNINYFIWLEFKRPKIDSKKVAGKQSDSQKDFERLFSESKNTRYYVVHSIEEAEKRLIQEEIILL